MQDNILYNPTCAVTGKTDNLRMYPIRNINGNMLGWVFLHESLDRKDYDMQFNCESANQTLIN